MRERDSLAKMASQEETDVSAAASATSGTDPLREYERRDVTLKFFDVSLDRLGASEVGVEWFTTYFLGVHFPANCVSGL